MFYDCRDASARADSIKEKCFSSESGKQVCTRWLQRCMDRCKQTIERQWDIKSCDGSESMMNLCEDAPIWHASMLENWKFRERFPNVCDMEVFHEPSGAVFHVHSFVMHQGSGMVRGLMNMNQELGQPNGAGLSIRISSTETSNPRVVACALFFMYNRLVVDIASCNTPCGDFALEYVRKVNLDLDVGELYAVANFLQCDELCDRIISYGVKTFSCRVHPSPNHPSHSRDFIESRLAKIIWKAEMLGCVELMDSAMKTMWDMLRSPLLLASHPFLFSKDTFFLACRKCKDTFMLWAPVLCLVMMLIFHEDKDEIKAFFENMATECQGEGLLIDPEKIRDGLIACWGKKIDDIMHGIDARSILALPKGYMGEDGVLALMDINPRLSIFNHEIGNFSIYCGVMCIAMVINGEGIYEEESGGSKFLYEYPSWIMSLVRVFGSSFTSTKFDLPQDEKSKAEINRIIFNEKRDILHCFMPMAPLHHSKEYIRYKHISSLLHAMHITREMFKRGLKTVHRGKRKRA